MVLAYQRGGEDAAVIVVLLLAGHTLSMEEPLSDVAGFGQGYILSTHLTIA